MLQLSTTSMHLHFARAARVAQLETGVGSVWSLAKRCILLLQLCRYVLFRFSPPLCNHAGATVSARLGRCLILSVLIISCVCGVWFLVFRKFGIELGRLIETSSPLQCQLDGKSFHGSLLVVVRVINSKRGTSVLKV